MRTATLTPIKKGKIHIPFIENQSDKGIPEDNATQLETTMKHYLLYNLDILLEVSKHEKLESNLETAASIIREYEFLSLVNEMNQEGL